MATSSTHSIREAYYFLATLLMTTAILYWGSVVFVPLALAILLAFVLSVPQRWLEQRGLPRYLSVLAVTLSAFAILGGLIWVVAGEFRSLASELPQYESNIQEKLAPLRGLAERVQKLEMAASPALAEKETASGTPTNAKEPAPRGAGPEHSVVINWLQAMVGPVLDVGTKTVLVIVLTVFILVRREDMTDRFLRLVGPRHLARTTKAMAEAGRRVSHYLLLQTFTNTCAGLGVAIGLHFVGVPYAPLWGVLTAGLRFIPYVGVWLAVLFPLLLSIGIFPSWTQPLLVLGLYLGLEMLMFNVIEPLLFGHGTGVTPLALLVAAAFWAWLWGPVGLFLSTPLTVCLVVIGKHAPALAFLDVLLQEAPVLAPAARFYQRLLAGDGVLAGRVLASYLRSHPHQAVYDEVLLPTLVRIRRDRQERQFTAEDEKTILHFFHELLVNIVGAALPSPAAATLPAIPRRVIACPARGLADELAVEMLRQSLSAEGIEVTVVAPGEALEAARVAREPGHQVMVCIVALPPGEVSLCVNVCKTVRAAVPAARIVTARWGSPDDADPAEQHMRAAGADEVATTLLQTRSQILSPPPPLQLPAPA